MPNYSHIQPYGDWFAVVDHENKIVAICESKDEAKVHASEHNAILNIERATPLNPAGTTGD